jgi:hypothetical protein
MNKSFKSQNSMLTCVIIEDPVYEIFDTYVWATMSNWDPILLNSLRHCL